MNETLTEKARDLGRLISQTDEYQALRRAQAAVDDDRDLVKLLNRLADLEEQVARALQRGEAPPESLREDYERVVSEVQSSATYQRLVAAQSNFERVLGRVNEEIGRGMEAGAQSRIILPS